MLRRAGAILAGRSYFAKRKTRNGKQSVQRSFDYEGFVHGCLTSKRSCPDEDHGKRYARDHGGVQHIISLPAPEALSSVLKGSPGSTQTACSR